MNIDVDFPFLKPVFFLMFKYLFSMQPEILSEIILDTHKLPF